MRKALTLPAELTIYAVGELRPTWLDWVGAVRGGKATTDANGKTSSSTDGKADFRVDGAAVDQVDAAGVQLLLSLAQALSQKKRRLQLVHASRPLAAACRVLGAEHLLAAERQTGAAA
ncbi:STAS domain-containing protein [Aquabacterium sp.]|uniref:STAS domain-containing protein n=1 Tax=Aquabacterium sp. TaxID=1872578 RepID=UPI002CD9C9C9|nr:STAS domain-containing protein [Aquabacterium sp.]HSW07177.1 STAS domain-containing protein [Aquabacterium sp.]